MKCENPDCPEGQPGYDSCAHMGLWAARDFGAWDPQSWPMNQVIPNGKYVVDKSGCDMGDLSRVTLLCRGCVEVFGLETVAIRINDLTTFEAGRADARIVRDIMER